jgi:SAM-dependent methyltransferase
MLANMIDVDAMTERLLKDAGIGSGARVLDVGCGRGDVSLLLGRLVGSSGSVVGLDRDASPLAMARERVREQARGNVSFVEGDLQDAAAHGEFDAIVGRRVLMYQRDAVAAIRALAGALRPGGIVVFQEVDATMIPACIVPLPVHARVYEWMWRTVEREGADRHIGFRLAAVLGEAGLAVEHLRAEAIVQTPTQLHDVAGIIRAVLPRIVHQGVATAAEIDVDTLERRLVEECNSTMATFIGDMLFGAWARKPG